MKYRAEIDGLRSVAVLPVILFHGGVSAFSGGYVGVDVFFVISGYLITTIVLQGLDAGTFTITDFYSRRARRILPALFFITLTTLPFAWVWMLPEQFEDYGQSIAAVSIFASNVLFWIESGYFAPAAELKPLLHTWSLAVEEQYYVLFPLLLMFVWRRSATLTVGILALIFTLSLATAEWGWRHIPSANFFLLPFRAWELMVGSLTAVWLLRLGGPLAPGPLAQAAAALGLGMIVAAVFLYDGQTPFPSLYALVPVLGTALVIICATPATVVGRGLACKLAVAIGLISYSAYLWHQPLFALARLARDVEPPHWVMWLLSATSLGLAALTWRFVEQPFRRPGQRMPAGRTVIVAGIASVVVGATGAALSVLPWQRSHFIRTIPVENRHLLALIEGAREGHHDSYDAPGGCIFPIAELSRAVRNRFEACHAQHGNAIALTGDSHSRDVHNGLSPALGRPFMVLINQAQCRPHIVGSDCTTGLLAETIDTYGDRIAHLFYVQAGFWLLLDAEGRELDRMLFGAGRDILDPQLDRAAIDRAIRVLQTFDAKVPVTWIGPRLEPYVFRDQMLSLPCSLAPERQMLRPGQREIFETLDAYLARTVPAAGIGYISEMKAVDYDPATEIYTCDALYWSDSDHWSVTGEAAFGPRLARAVEATLHDLETN